MDSRLEVLRVSESGEISDVHSVAAFGQEDYAVGRILAGKYRVERIIGEGAMGIVLAATHLELDELVAIKFIRPEVQRVPGVVTRFAREAKALVRIKSDHVASVLDVGVTAPIGPYIVMEHLQGEDLGSLLDRVGFFPHDRAVEYVMQACEALSIAHASGIVHRDVKPENLFLTRRGEYELVKVLDFGVSKANLSGRVFGDDLSLRRTTMAVGTPLYMSPEQIRATKEVDARTDIWSLGAVLYELLTGRTAFVGSCVTQVCAMVLETQPAPLTQDGPELPAGLQLVIDRCLQKDPNLRFQTCAELAFALLPFAPSRARLHAERSQSVLVGGSNPGETLAVAPSSVSPASVRPASVPPSSFQPSSVSSASAAPASVSPASVSPASVAPGSQSSVSRRMVAPGSHSSSPVIEYVDAPSSTAPVVADDLPLELRPRFGRYAGAMALGAAAFAVAWVLRGSHALELTSSTPNGAAAVADTAPAVPVNAPLPRAATPVPPMDSDRSATPLGGPESAPAAALQMQSLVVESEPAGASVVLEGRVLGITPLRIQLPRRMVTLGLAKPQFGGRTLRVDLASPDVDPGVAVVVREKLSPTKGSVSPANRRGSAPNGSSRQPRDSVPGNPTATSDDTVSYDTGSSSAADPAASGETPRPKLVEERPRVKLLE